LTADVSLGCAAPTDVGTSLGRGSAAVAIRHWEDVEVRIGELVKKAVS
jgi:hypothetical protein